MQIQQEFKYNLLPAHLKGMKNDDLAIREAVETTGDIDILLEWYTGRKMLPALKPLCYAPHPNKFILGSWGSGKCLAASTRIAMADGRLLSISEVKPHDKVASFDTTTRKLRDGEVVGCYENGVKPILEIRTATGNIIECTPNHPFLTVLGYVEAQHLKVGGLVALAHSDVYWDWVILVRKFPPEMTYDLEVEPYHNFIANGFVVHNTVNMAGYALIELLSNSYFKFVNLAPVGRQAELMFRYLRTQITNNARISHLIDKVREKPYPLIKFWNGSSAEFLTAKPEYLDYLQGEEFDHGNIDEAALLGEFARTVGILRSRLRGIRQRTNVPRLHLLTITTVPGVDDVLRERYELGLTDNPDYISLKLIASQHNPFVSKEDLRLMLQDIPSEDVPIYMDCEWPETSGRLIQAQHYEACESIEMNQQMDDLIQNGVMGAAYQEYPRIGCIHWELPYEHGHTYVTSGDPGTVNPPKRNSGVVMAWDVTTYPTELVYFDWVFGNGSIGPWVTSFKYAKEKYPGHSGFDTTGTQKYMDELVFEKEGIIVEPLNFRRDKYGFINSLRMMLESQGLKFPFIQAMKSQAMKYDLPDDNLNQDTTACLMMSTWMIRPSLRMEQISNDRLPYLWRPRGYRNSRSVARRAR